jgi:hypothetical protein
LLLTLATTLAGCGGAAPGGATTSSSTSAASETAASLPQGVTSEGYHYLGQANAPVTIENYSDFL